MPYELVIFDCDGVLVDSEPASNRVLARMLSEAGLPTSYEQALARYKGRSWASCVEAIEAALGAPLPGDFRPRYKHAVEDEFRRTLEAVPGVADVLAELELRTCVASSGEHDKMRLTLGLVRLWSYFEGRVFSATEVPRGKPAPDLFLHAALRMGTPPARCAVVEDSSVGVEAARAAGMTPLGFAGTSSADADALERAGAVVFRDMAELPGLLSGRP